MFAAVKDWHSIPVPQGVHILAKNRDHRGCIIFNHFPLDARSKNDEKIEYGIMGFGNGDSMENIEALQALERGDKEKVDQNTLRSLHGAQLINLSSVSPVGSSGTELVFAGFTPQGRRLLEENKISLVSDVERQILNTIVRGFLDHQQPSSKRTLLQQFQSSISDDLQRLTGRGVLALANNSYPNETYLPKTLAFFHCGDPAALAFAKKSTQTVLRVLPILFNKDLASDGEAQKQFTPEDVLTEAKAIDSSIEPNAVFTGLYLAQEFSVFSGLRMDARNVGIVSFSLGERVYEKRYLDWDERIRQGNIGLIYDQQSQLKKDAVPVSIPTNLDLIDAEGLEPYAFQPHNSMLIRDQRMNSLAVLISHSSKDADLATALIELLRAGLGLLATQIRCSSVDGYRLPAGVDSDAQLRKEIVDAGVLVGLLTPNSLSSTYVLFELGARWGIQRPMIPLLAGVTPEEMRGPHRVLNALSCSNESQLIQFIEDIGRELKIGPQSSASYLDKVRAVKKLADAVESRPVGNTSGEQVVYEESVYWKMKEGKREGPYCPTCYDSKGKLVHLNPGATKGTYGCGACRNSFRTNEYSPRAARRRPFSSR